MRRGYAVVSTLAAVAVALAGCSTTVSRASAAPPQVAVTRLPASAAGGACIMLDYGAVQQRLGVRFDVAAADQADETSTCVLQSETGSHPDLVLSVVERTDADAAEFLRHMKPAGATAVARLGKAAYRQVTAGGAGAGPVVEVGILTDDAQIMTLRFTFAPGAGGPQAQAMAGKLIALARSLDGQDL